MFLINLKYNYKNILSTLAIILLVILIVYPELMDAKHPEIAYTAGVAIVMAVFWMTEIIPLPVTSLFPIALYPILGIMDGKSVSSIYFNHIIFLFIGGFIMALAMEKWNLHRRIALKLLLKIGTSPAKILLGFMLATAFLSMWISNTATTMMMIPILISISVKLEETNPGISIANMEKAMLLGIAYAASIGGIATLIGTPPNPLFIKVFQIYFPKGPDISFADWMIFALPLSILLLIFTYLYLYLVYFKKNKANFEIGKQVLEKEYLDLGKISYEQKLILFLFISLAGLWLFRKPINLGSFTIPGWSQIFTHPNWITDGNIAIFIGVLLFLIPAKNNKGYLMDWKTAERIPWGIILLFGGGFALAKGFKDSGLSTFIGESLSILQNIHPLLILLIIILTITFLTELTSNTATTQTFLPILASLSMAMKINPLFFMIPATIAASFAFMLPVATPPNAIVFATGKLQIKDMMKTGFWMNIIGIIVLTTIAWLYMSWVFDIQLQIFPDWAK